MVYKRSEKFKCKLSNLHFFQRTNEILSYFCTKANLFLNFFDLYQKKYISLICNQIKLFHHWSSYLIWFDCFVIICNSFLIGILEGRSRSSTNGRHGKVCLELHDCVLEWIRNLFWFYSCCDDNSQVSNSMRRFVTHINIVALHGPYTVNNQY